MDLQARIKTFRSNFTQTIVNSSGLRHLTYIIAVVLTYGAIFMPLYYFWGKGISLLIIIPVAMTGWFFGTPLGLLASLLALLYNILLTRIVEPTDFNGMALANWAINLAIYAIVGFVSGRLYDLRIKQKIEALVSSTDGVPPNSTPLLAMSLFDASVTGMVDFMPEASFAINVDGKVVAWNRAMTRLSGIEAADIMGKPCSEAALPFFGARRDMLAQSVIQNASQGTSDAEREFPRIVKDGRSLVVEIFLPQFRAGGAYLWMKASPLFDAAGHLVGAVQTLRDVTEVRLSQERLGVVEQLDDITGLQTQSYFDAELARFNDSTSYPISLILVSLPGAAEQPGEDGGRQHEGDRLRLAARAIQSAFRASDPVARIGERQFGVLLPKADAQVAQRTSERVRKALGVRDMALASVVAVTCQEKGMLGETLNEARSLLAAGER